MKTAFGALFLICLTANALADDNPVGFRSSTLQDTHNDRSLEMVVWYPSATTATTQLISDNVAFFGAAAVRDTPPAAGEHPLVVLSHGFGGNWSNQTWLASALAHKGYIVAAVNHPGTTSRDRSPPAAAQLWQRPVDLSRAIEAVTTQPEKFGLVAKRRIAVVGHSLGGWTVMEIAGARFDPDRFTRDCKAHPQLSSCTNYQQINPASTSALKAGLAADLRDKRVTAVVTLDLGLSRGLTDESLAALPVPALVIAAGAPSQELPAQLESANLAKRLPQASSRYVEISDASHFSFMSVCKPGAVALLEEAVPGDGIICRDGDNGRSRELIQQQITSLITEFLAQSSGDREDIL
ncbi:alpha/beta fold hydrolase [Pseudomonas chlororaphis]|uniref:alpha/beta hydrolase family protein n=1 Tax=Pseudomonas chlororaphis TaxID=587753 RepID=UPI0006A63010|nr:alpha/beta fold hydrolase [Pseudomonas chlororaphis]AZC30604.1 putative lipoprotein signal peptide [Pseudomonas chlororaphis subsp. piscium]WDG78699.1 alpha/beta fold hydrolase [Pseudomonas chlororaphis]WDG88250.1 alpha/beta fold hydrolase [Pseudomonas chlororaphis]WDG94503.1 alpha/beta fold hydrolase [Pseudomonas chlororaphis]SDT13943.1 Predicted dienelactone hydrolase [Pseudomonas chlororaphis]